MAFRTELAHTIFMQKYAHEGCETWEKLAKTLAYDVCSGLLPKDEIDEIAQLITEFKFIPGGRYLYYAGRPIKAFQNCFMLKAEEDSREDWANLSWKVENCLMTGGGLGVDYSIYRGAGSKLTRTGGHASGPVSKMRMINEIGREVMQGGSRRSALWAGLNWQHPDIQEFLSAKDWERMMIPGTDISLKRAKEVDFNWPAPLDMTNISVNYDDDWLKDPLNEVFMQNVRQALRTGEPGFAFNFGKDWNHTLRNACNELVSEDDSDVCNIGSVNMAECDTLQEFELAVELGTKFLYCGTIKADVPYSKVRTVREKNRRLGLGLLGVHEWLLKRGARYEVTPEMQVWLKNYKTLSDWFADGTADRLGLSRSVGKRAIAPTGTIGLIAGTTTGIEPLYAVAYKRRYLKNGTDWHYQYVIDGTAKELIDRYDVDPDTIESAIDLAADPERRIAFQADVQDYVDHGISSTINLPAWGSELNNEDKVQGFAETLAEYAPRLRGFTCYPDGSRGGQPLVSVPYKEAIDWVGFEYAEHSSCRDGVCGI